MSYAICLDQNTPNFNIGNISPNGFTIYANLGAGFNTIIASGIPANQLFQPPVGTCPYIVNVPQGTTQILVVDLCNVELDVTSIFSPENIAAGTITTECCYAIIDIPQEPPPTFCEECTLTFDTFLTGTTGSIVAGNLSSTCGPVTDYTIGWYLNGDYSAPVITSGYGTSFIPYQFTHPLTGNSSVPVLAGNWEGIIHDIKINGVTYSSVSGSAGGLAIPFESCFDTVVAQPLKCDNGAFQGIAKYSHQITFNSQAAGATPAPVSLTYALDPTTKYFAYAFQGYSIDDEIEIKWKSGDPNATSNPSFYSQSIYLEKLKVGWNISNLDLPNSHPPVVNNIWPKSLKLFGTDYFRKTLTLTNLETSSNPLAPDLLEITVTPNSNNNNTQWKAGFACLDDFICGDCSFDSWPNSLPEISQIHLQKQYGCDAQKILLNISGCWHNTDWMDWGFGADPFNSLYGSLIRSYSNWNGPNWQQQHNYIPLSDITQCGQTGYATAVICDTPSTGTITLTKTPNNVKLTFDNVNDYNHYVNDLTNNFNILSVTNGTNITSSVPCPANSAGSNTLQYYRAFRLRVPIQQNANVNCGDNSSTFTTDFHINDYFNITYTANPATNFWEINIPQSQIVNCYALLNCDSCYNLVNNFVVNHNNNINNPSTLTFTTNVGSRYTQPFKIVYITGPLTNQGASGSNCQIMWPLDNGYMWYSTYTMPFIPNPAVPGTWTNLTNLAASLSCSTTPYLYNGILGGIYSYFGYTTGYIIRYPNLTGSFDYTLSTNDFEIYATVGYGATGSNNNTPGVWPAP